MRRFALEDIDQAIRALRATGGERAEAAPTVTGVLADVRAGGRRAARLTARFDGVELAAPLAVPGETLGTPWRRARTGAGRRADGGRRTREDHAPRRRGPGERACQGQTVGQEIRPLAAAGLLVPGGLANYPSSVLMTAIPAQVAGVASSSSARRRAGRLGPSGLAAACRCRRRPACTRRRRPAVAAMAYGDSVGAALRPDLGPGNATSPRPSARSIGEVAIDGLAAREVLIVADRRADLEWLAADLLAQAEHGAGRSGAVLSSTAALSDRLETEIGAPVGSGCSIDIDNVTMVDFGLKAAMKLVNFGPRMPLHWATGG